MERSRLAIYGAGRSERMEGSSLGRCFPTFHPGWLIGHLEAGLGWQAGGTYPHAQRKETATKHHAQ
jgi:hypothetical protein